MSNMKTKLFILIMSLVFLLVLYKYYEFGILTDIEKYHSQSITQEMSEIRDYQKILKKLDSDIGRAFGVTETKKNKEVKKSDQEILNDGISALNIKKEKYRQYVKLVDEHEAEFNLLRGRSKYLFGARGAFANRLISKQLEYYDLDSKVAQRVITSFDYGLNLLTIDEDRKKMIKFISDTGNASKNYSKYFNEISSLEKYTRSSYKFSGEDQIRELRPLAYELLMKNKEYFGIYYQIIKDYVEGDTESGNYKLTKLNTIRANFNFDTKRVDEESEESDRGLVIGAAGSVLNQVELIQDFKFKKLGVYPFNMNISGWKDQLLLCDSYQYRSGIFKWITNNYVKSMNQADMVKEFKDSGIQVSDVDNRFNGKLVITNDKDKLIFTCVDQDSGEEYTNEILKN